METASKQKAITSEQAKDILRISSDRESFILKNNQGVVITSINGIEQLANALVWMSSESFTYHASRGDFQKWIGWLGFEKLANMLAKARTQKEATESVGWGVNYLKGIISPENENLELSAQPSPLDRILIDKFIRHSPPQKVSREALLVDAYKDFIPDITKADASLFAERLSRKKALFKEREGAEFATPCPLEQIIISAAKQHLKFFKELQVNTVQRSRVLLCLDSLYSEFYSSGVQLFVKGMVQTGNLIDAVVAAARLFVEEREARIEQAEVYHLLKLFDLKTTKTNFAMLDDSLRKKSPPFAQDLSEQKKLLELARTTCNTIDEESDRLEDYQRKYKDAAASKSFPKCEFVFDFTPAINSISKELSETCNALREGLSALYDFVENDYSARIQQASDAVKKRYSQPVKTTDNFSADLLKSIREVLNEWDFFYGFFEIKRKKVPEKTTPYYKQLEHLEEILLAEKDIRERIDVYSQTMLRVEQLFSNQITIEDFNLVLHVEKEILVNNKTMQEKFRKYDELNQLVSLLKSKHDALKEELKKKISESAKTVEEHYNSIIAQAFERTDYKKKEDFSKADIDSLENVLTELHILWRFYNTTRRVKSRNKLRGDIYELAGNRETIKEFLAAKSKVEGTVAEIRKKEADVLAIFGSDMDSSGICSLGEAKIAADSYKKKNPLHNIHKEIKVLPCWTNLSKSYELACNSLESTTKEKEALALESLDSLFDSERLKEETKRTFVFDRDTAKLDEVLGQLMVAHRFYNELSSIGVDIGDGVGVADSKITELKKELQSIYELKKISEKITEDAKATDKLIDSLLREFVSNIPLDEKAKEKIQLISKLKKEVMVWKGKYNQYNENNYLTDFVRKYDCAVGALETQIAEKTSESLEFLAQEVSARKKRLGELSDFKSERAYNLEQDLSSCETILTELRAIKSLYGAFARIGADTKTQIRQTGRTIKSFENLLFNLYTFRKAYQVIVNHTSQVRDKVPPTTKHYTLPLLILITKELTEDKGKYSEYEDNDYIKAAVAEYRKTAQHLEQVISQAILDSITDLSSRIKNEITSVKGLFAEGVDKEELGRLDSLRKIKEECLAEYKKWAALPIPNHEQHEALLKDLESEIEKKRQQGIEKLNAELQQMKKAIVDFDYTKENYIEALAGLAIMLKKKDFAELYRQLSHKEEVTEIRAVKESIEAHIKYKKDYNQLKDSLKKASEIFSPAQRIDELVQDLTALDVLRNIQRTKETEYCTANNDRLYLTNTKLAFGLEEKIKEAVSRAIQLADLRFNEISKTYESRTANICTAISHTKGKENELMLLKYLYEGIGHEESETAELQTKISALSEKYKTVEKTIEELTKKIDECRSSPYVEETAAFIKESEVRKNTIEHINKFIIQLSSCRKQVAEAQRQYGRFFSETMKMITGLCEEELYQITHKFTILNDEKTNLCDELDKIKSCTGFKKYMHLIKSYHNYRRSVEIERHLLHLDKQASVFQKIEYGKLA